MNLSTLNREDINWCVKRLPQEVKDLMRDNTGQLTLAGGYIRSRIANEPVNDIDLFSPNKDKAANWAHRIINTQYHYGTTNSKVHTTDNAYSVRLKSGTFVQFIHRWTFEKPEDVVPSFDFTIAQAAIWHHRKPDGTFEWTSLCSDRFYQDLAAKRLVYTQPLRNEDAGGSLLRVIKFVKRGYNIPLPSLSEVVARLVKDTNFDDIKIASTKLGNLDVQSYENRIAKVLCGLLREVDPNTPVD